MKTNAATAPLSAPSLLAKPLGCSEDAGISPRHSCPRKCDPDIYQISGSHRPTATGHRRLIAPSSAPPAPPKRLAKGESRGAEAADIW